MNRYASQIALTPIGEEGQRRLASAAAAVVGCGALGSHCAELLVRAGVGRVRIVDRDLVDISNLHRQVLFDEQDARNELSKPEAAARHLSAINSEVCIEPMLMDVRPKNVLDVLSGVDIILDGTDNFETRYLLNDAAVKLGIPWVYGGVTGTEGMVLAVRPGESACLRCLFPDPPAPGSLPTCQAVGVLNTGPALVAALEVSAAIQFLVEGHSAGENHLHIFDLWNWQMRRVPVARSDSCPTCVQRRLDFLAGVGQSRAEVICGRDSVQVFPSTAVELDMEEIAERCENIGTVRRQGALLRIELDGHGVVLFPDGRIIVQKTKDPILARALYARLVGV